ncbi:MAG: hypothetical protein RLZ47_316 [Bacteroidota bacterium]
MKKLIYVSLAVLLAANVVALANPMDEQVPILGGNKADCYSTYDISGTTVFFQCMSCSERIGTPSGDTRTCSN